MINNTRTIYNDYYVKRFLFASLFWMVIGLGLGVWIASQLVLPDVMNLNEYFSFGRMRPLHTTGVVIAFAGNVLMTASLFVVQRTCATGLIGGDKYVRILFYGFQIFLVGVVISYLLGYTQSKEYAEPEWFLDIILAVLWLLYAYIFIGTLKNRREPHIYVSNWFFLAFIITVAILHVINNLSIPVSWSGGKSYTIYSGVQDAMVQWWYGHNMVGFLLTAGFIGIMYYFLPKQAERPIFSYRLSIVHFWALVFLYIWAGPHHLHYTALPDWAQTLGMAFSIMLWMPSWGGAINGIMTLNGAWHKLRTDPVIRFLVVGVAFYGLATFEGPLMAIKYINSLSHYTDWTIGHVHSGSLGWVAFTAFGALYHLTARFWGNDGRMASITLINLHFWFASIGILFYIIAMWVSGISQGLMWREYDDMGFLEYAFIEVVQFTKPYHHMRLLGGILYLVGALIMVYNVAMTVNRSKKRVLENAIQS